MSVKERVSRYTIRYGDDQGDDRTNLTLRGFATYGTPFTNNDGIVKKATGLEAASLTVTGGPVSYGGSTYTGVRENDREITLTVTPAGMSLNELKHKINALIGLSRIQPLTFIMDTFFDGTTGAYSTLSAECYITEVSAPLMDAGTDLILTLKCPKPYFQRPPVALYTSGNLEGSEYAFTPANKNNSYWEYTIKPTSFYEDRAITAPSPFVVRIGIPASLKTSVESMSLFDELANEYTVWMNTRFKENTSAGGDAEVWFNSYSRVTGIVVGTGHPATVNGGETTYIYPEWPMVYRSVSNLKVIVTFTDGMTPSPTSANEFSLEAYLVYPRMYGV